MASSLPIPAPPRTPTPPTPISEESEEGLGIGAGTRTVRSTFIFDSRSLSPISDTLPRQFGSMGSPMPSSAGLSSAGLGTPSFGFDSSLSPRPPQAGPRSPFNFQTQSIKDAPVLANSASKRRGHRYKHSSVSTQHQIFLEPPPRAPLALPASLPIPTYKEAWTSRSKEQTTRIAWCACHALVAAYVLFSAGGSLALTALSHLIFFDAISATICVVVDVLSNFEVWKRSSIRHPFGLERTEVLAGFAMSVFLLFMGFDLLSHNIKHVLEGLGSHAPHHPHSHERVSPATVGAAAVLSIVATLISAYGLKNHARIGKAMRFAVISSLPGMLSNPSHLLTLSCSAVMLPLPLLTTSVFIWLDRLLCAVIALSMFFLGIRLAMTQGLMLLMSYSGEGVSDVMREIHKEPMIIQVEEARFWQVHYGLCMANLKLRVRGDDIQQARLRDRINMLVKNRLGGGYGKGTSVKWEVTMQLTIGK
ncbi:cation efflux family protein family [Diplocarpon rosae]|nr:cation efflux family protein family [Diplocarpon rosae]